MNGVGFSLSIVSLSLALVFSAPAAVAQTANETSTPIQAASATVAFSQAELDQMLAPIALYPDTVLSHVLIAATYPLEIVKATRWLSTQSAMTSEQALKAAENEPWDPSVRALVAFPPLLTKMNNELEWTQKLGDAFLMQEEQLMATVQALRERAYAAGNLQDQEHIVVQRQEKVIVIEPRQPEVVYVPVYDTRVVYGDWMWREYPPIHWPYPNYYSGGSYVYWGLGARVSSAFYFSTFYWPQRQIVVINPQHRPNYYYRPRDIVRHEERRHWRHDPKHRLGVVYHQGYQPTREMQGQRYQQADVGEKRRWAADQRQRNNISMPEDRRIREQYPIQQRSTTLTKERAGTDIDRERLQQHRANENPRREQRSIDRDSKKGDLPNRPATERQMTVDSGSYRGKSREMKERVDLPTPTGSDQLRQERPVYNTPRQIERAERRDSNIARSVEQQRPVYETTKPIDRQYPRERQERQERPVYAVPKPIERQERQERPVYETPRRIERQERQERPVYETPRPIERQQPSYQAPRQMERASRPQESSRPERQRTVERRGSIE
ncbi:MAG: DUF3300 domain-containing protein [Gammaproteobacteria bacterium]|nr:DUF3300 domain-containing protein [Gammaproteobacteria bacterium]